MDSIWDIYDGIYRECRSLVIDVKNEVIVLCPFRKFRNINECKETNIDIICSMMKTAKSIEVSNKLDGSMQSANWYQGKVVMSGSQAIDESQSWRLTEGYQMFYANPNYEIMVKSYPCLTFIFEYISLNDVHVVKYSKEQQGLYLIGIRNNMIGTQYSYREVIDIANTFNIPSTTVVNKPFEEIDEDMRNKRSDEFEGYVWNIDGFMCKQKCDDYLRMRLVIHSISSEKAVIKAIADGYYDDLLSKVPSAYKERVEKIANVVFNYIHETDEIVNRLYNFAPKYDKKDFMIYVNQNVPKCYQSYVRNLYLGVSNNYLKTSHDEPHYKNLKEMGVKND